MGRALGIDLGRRRVGVAVTDGAGTLAVPYEVVDRKTTDLVARLTAIVAEEGIERVVVGLPLSLDGTEGPAATAARQEAEVLAAALAVPVEVFDERLTTVSAHRPLMERKMKSDARRRVVDKVAAAVMLQNWLEVHK